MRSILVLAIALCACSSSSSSSSGGSTTPTDGGGGGGESTEAGGKEAPKPEPLSLDARIKVHDDCFEAFLKEDASAIPRCYNEQSTSDMVDSSQPPASGLAAIQESAQPFWNAFTLGGEQVVTLGAGNEVVDIHAIWGTHDGQFGELAATNKKFGLMGAEIQNLQDDGKHGNVRLYVDQATLIGQLTTPKKVRKPVEASGKERVLVLASGSDVEKANLETAKKGLELWNARDLKGLEALYAADAVFAPQAAKADVVGAKKITGYFKKAQKAFSDGKLVADKMWAAGDWVVLEGTFTGTNDGVWKEMGITKKTGKPVTLHEAHIIQFTDGKVKQHWHFVNGMAMAAQLGLLPPPKAPADAKAEKADAKAEAKTDKAEAKIEKKDDKAEAKTDKAEAKVEKKDDKAEAKADKAAAKPEAPKAK